MESLHQMLGSLAMLKDLGKLGVKDTLQYDTYWDKLQNAETFPMLDEEPR